MTEQKRPSEAERSQIDDTLWRLAKIEQRLELARAPIAALLRPLDKVQAEIDEQRFALLEAHGVAVAGHCEVCKRLLFVGEPGQRPYFGKTEFVFCGEHIMSYGDLLRHWQQSGAEDDGGDEGGEARQEAMALIDAHIAGGGALDDKIPGVL